MNRDVIISINGLQFVEGEPDSEPVEVFAPGEHYMEDGYHCLVFDQLTDEFEEPVHTRLKFDHNSLEILKTGSTETQMLIEKDRRTISCYTTPFGSMDVGVSTTDVVLTEDENFLDIKAEYAMDVNGTFVGDCVVHVSARSKGSDIRF